MTVGDNGNIGGVLLLGVALSNVDSLLVRKFVWLPVERMCRRRKIESKLCVLWCRRVVVADEMRKSFNVGSNGVIYSQQLVSGMEADRSAPSTASRAWQHVIPFGRRYRRRAWERAAWAWHDYSRTCSVESVRSLPPWLLVLVAVLAVLSQRTAGRRPRAASRKQRMGLVEEAALTEQTSSYTLLPEIDVR